MVLRIFLRLFIILNMLPYVQCFLQLTHSILFLHHISKLSSTRSSALFSIQLREPYITTLHTYNFTKSFVMNFTIILRLLEHTNVFLFMKAEFACAILDFIS